MLQKSKKMSSIWLINNLKIKLVKDKRIKLIKLTKGKDQKLLRKFKTHLKLLFMMSL